MPMLRPKKNIMCMLNKLLSTAATSRLTASSGGVGYIQHRAVVDEEDKSVG